MTSTGKGIWVQVAARAAEVVLFGLLISFAVVLAFGFRPVILVSGSMAPTAPEGSLIVVADVPAADVEVDDIVVMDRGSDMLVTHRIIELSEVDGRLLAVTKGDANPTPDPVDYEILGSQRIVTLVVPVLGSLLLPIAGSLALGVLVSGAVMAVLANGFRRFLKNRTNRPMEQLPETVG